MHNQIVRNKFHAPDKTGIAANADAIPDQMLTNACREMSASHYMLHMKTCRQRANGDREEL